MFFSKIKGRKLPVLEQACQRYALMTYEVFWSDIAYGFKSIQFSYEDSDTLRRGRFTATFVPFPDELGGSIVTEVTFEIAETTQTEKYGCWELSHGKVIVSDGFYAGIHEILFVGTSRNDIAVMVPNNNPDMRYVYHVGTGPEPRVCNLQALRDHGLNDWNLIQVLTR